MTRSEAARRAKSSVRRRTGRASTAGGNEQFSFDDVGFLRSVLAIWRRRRTRGGPRRRGAMPGQDFEVPVEISIEDAFRGTTLSLSLSMPEYDAAGAVRRVPHTVKARVAPGAIDGQRLRLPGKGGKGFQGGRDGDLYLDISLKPHRLYRATGHDLYLDLPLAPWEAALGATVEVPTLAGPVSLKVPAGHLVGAEAAARGPRTAEAARWRGRSVRGGADRRARASWANASASCIEELGEELAIQSAPAFRRGGHMSIETEVLWLDEHRVVSLRELIEFSGLSEAELLELVHSGAMPANDGPGRVTASVRA